MQFEAVVFPGQGAQKLGMAQDFCQTYAQSADVFETAQSVLPFDIEKICFEEAEKLNLTEFTQPAIVTAEMAMFNAIKACHGLKPDYFAGHSLGEYAALIAANVMPLDLALNLVYKRGQLMQNVNADGGMTAVIMDSIPMDKVQEIANQKGVDVANDNSIQQVVLSGPKAELSEVCDELATLFPAEGFRAVELKVSAPFHSRAMKDIEEEFHAYLSQYKDSYASTQLSHVVSNYLGGFYACDINQLVDSLACQLSGSVRWRDNMAAIASKTSRILELGPNRPLRGFFKTLGIDITSVINVRNAVKIWG